MGQKWPIKHTLYCSSVWLTCIHKKIIPGSKMTHKIWTKTNNPFFYFFFTGQKWPMTQSLKCHWDQPVSSENMSYTLAAHARSAFTEEEACEGVDPPPPQPKWASEVINRCEMTPKHTQKWAKASHERVWDPAVVITALQTADQAAQAANYSNYDSLLAEINLIKRRLQSSLTFIRIIIDTRHTPAHTPTCTVRGGGGLGNPPKEPTWKQLMGKVLWRSSSSSSSDYCLQLQIPWIPSIHIDVKGLGSVLTQTFLQMSPDRR